MLSRPFFAFYLCLSSCGSVIRGVSRDGETQFSFYGCKLDLTSRGCSSLITNFFSSNKLKFAWAKSWRDMRGFQNCFYFCSTTSKSLSRDILKFSDFAKKSKNFKNFKFDEIEILLCKSHVFFQKKTSETLIS